MLKVALVRPKYAPAAGSVYHPTDAHRYELLVDAIADYAICMLDAEGFVTTWSKGAENIKGYNAVEITVGISHGFSPLRIRRTGFPKLC